MKESFLQVIMAAYKRAAAHNLLDDYEEISHGGTIDDAAESFERARDQDHAHHEHEQEYGTYALFSDQRPRKRPRGLDSSSSVTTGTTSAAALGASSAGSISGKRQNRKTRNGTKRRANDRRLWLACPYAKRDPVRYRDCHRYFLGRVRDVKQHLTRCHRRPMCPMCSMTFEDEDVKNEHIKARWCSEPLPATTTGTTRDDA